MNWGKLFLIGFIIVAGAGVAWLLMQEIRNAWKMIKVKRAERDVQADADAKKALAAHDAECGCGNTAHTAEHGGQKINEGEKKDDGVPKTI